MKKKTSIGLIFTLPVFILIFGLTRKYVKKWQKEENIKKMKKEYIENHTPMNPVQRDIWLEKIKRLEEAEKKRLEEETTQD